jgi:hypothetical protein
MVLALGPKDVKNLITIKEAFDAMEQGFLDWANNKWLGELRQRVHSVDGVRLTVHLGAPNSAGVMGSYLHTEKVLIGEDDLQTYSARGARCRIVYDGVSGELLSIQIGELEVKELPGVNSNVVIPTSCATAVGTKWLARKNSRCVGILGSRGQAKAQLAAVKAALPGIEEAVVYSPNPDNRRAYAELMAGVLGISISAVDSSEEVVSKADILLSATNSNVPTFDGNWLKPGTHVTSLVSSNKGLHEGGFIKEARREIDDVTLQRADIIVCNSVEQDKLDRTAIVWGAAEEGVISWDKVFDLAQVMNKEVARTSDDQITFFKQNAFWGVGDQVIGKLLYDKAREQGLGVDLDMDGFESEMDSRYEG